jgi:hypothetical protein
VETMKVPKSIMIEDKFLVVDGVHFALSILPQLLYEITHPDPRKWYRLERIGDAIQVHVRISEDSNGNVIVTNAGRSSEGAGG